MKKIEKLEYWHEYRDGNGKYIGEKPIRKALILQKVNEIIDAYNSYFAPDLSKKQSEEIRGNKADWVKIEEANISPRQQEIFESFSKGKRICVGCVYGKGYGNHSYIVQPEKQEEWKKEYIERFALRFMKCNACGHHEIDHYWNGAGNPEYSAYDSCRIEGCKCEYSEDNMEETIDTNSVQDEMDFIQQLLSERTEEVLEDFYRFTCKDRMKSGWAELERAVEKYKKSKLLNKEEEC